jgi:hypothetical protein
VQRGTDGGRRRCEVQLAGALFLQAVHASTEGAQGGGTPHCSAHGGRKRCQHDGCTKAAARSGTPHCQAHGGGKRCQHDGCTKWAHGGGTPHCSAHGGGKRCQHDGCSKGAQGGGTPHCQAHGGGKRCHQGGCTKPVAQAAGSTLCTLCLRGALPQPDGAEAQQPSAPELALSLREREAIQRLVEDFA